MEINNPHKIVIGNKVKIKYDKEQFVEKIKPYHKLLNNDVDNKILSLYSHLLNDKYNDTFYVSNILNNDTVASLYDDNGRYVVLLPLFMLKRIGNGDK